MNLLFLEKHRQRTAKGTRREKASLLKRPREAAPAPLEAPRSPACAEAALPVGVRVHLLTEVLDGSPVLFRHAWVCGFICRENKTITASMMKDMHLLPPNARQPRAVTSHPEGTGPSRQTPEGHARAARARVQGVARDAAPTTQAAVAALRPPPGSPAAAL